MYSDDEYDEHDLGICQGCGAYGPAGTTHTRNGEECGEYV